MRYATKRDVIEQEILPALGDYADQHDVEAIADATFVYRVETDERGRKLLDTAGYVRAVGETRFWEIVKRHQVAETPERCCPNVQRERGPSYDQAEQADHYANPLRTVTDRDMRDQVRLSLGSDVADYDVHAIVEELQASFGTVSTETIEHDAYWAIVAGHTLTRSVRRIG